MRICATALPILIVPQAVDNGAGDTAARNLHNSVKKSKRTFGSVRIVVARPPYIMILILMCLQVACERHLYGDARRLQAYAAHGDVI
jgi:hypothetical protein